jgi:ATP-dependent DNA helicase HFM1/MER3
MCETELEAKYRSLTQGRTQLESCLHNNLTEHVNSEIGLGTITNVESAKAWLRSSFLFQRIQHNPRHYAIGKERDQTWQEKLDEMVMESIEQLKENQLVESSSDDKSSLSSTEFGDIMSKVSSAYHC